MLFRSQLAWFPSHDKDQIEENSSSWAESASAEVFLGKADYELNQLVRAKKSRAKREDQKTKPIATAINSVLKELELSEFSFSPTCWTGWIWLIFNSYWLYSIPFLILFVRCVHPFSKLFSGFLGCPKRKTDFEDLA